MIDKNENMTFGVSRSIYGDPLIVRLMVISYYHIWRGSVEARYILTMTIYGHYGVRDVVKLQSIRSINDERVQRRTVVFGSPLSDCWLTGIDAYVRAVVPRSSGVCISVLCYVSCGGHFRSLVPWWTLWDPPVRFCWVALTALGVLVIESVRVMGRKARTA